MIEVGHVSKRFGARVALADISLTFAPGEVTLLLGANGAGKSTLLRAIMGVIACEGLIRVDGLDPVDHGRAVRARIGYMPQSGGLHPELTVEDTLRFYAAIRRSDPGRAALLLREAGLAGHASAKVGELSGGLRQRLGFAVALLGDPRILVLDEPSASLDAASRSWLAARLRAMADEGRVVIVSTHAGQELLDTGDRRVVLEDGRVISDEGGAARDRSAPEVRLLPQAAATRPGSIVPLMWKELTDAIGSRWLVGYAVLLGSLGCAAAWTGIDSASGLALQAFGRTTATLMNLCLLIAPLVAVLMGAAAIASERDRGTLEHLLAQPVSRTGVLLAKHAGLLVSLTLATIAGFLPAGLLIAGAAGPGLVAHYSIFPVIAALAGAAMAGVGILASVASRSAVQSQGVAVFAWFWFVLLYDLLLIGTLAVGSLPVPLVSAALVANPVDAARVLGVLSLEPDLYLLGPAGAYLTGQLGRSGTAALLVLALAVWAVVPVAAAIRVFALGRRPRTPRSRATAAAADATAAELCAGPGRVASRSVKEVVSS
jgi:ABC-type multidrug transport system ATPase subunit/ABC-type transport system involved in multi-copper enzyme maturation permease subunit